MSVIDWSKAPEGATHYLKDSPQPWRDLSGDNWLWFWQGQWHGEGEKSILNNTSACLIRSQGDQLVPRPMALPAWNGEGLPPVGTVCEVRFPEDDKPQWEPVTVVYSGSRFGSVKFEDGKVSEFAIQGKEVEFRPIRTAEQIAEEERKDAIDKMVQFFMNYYGNPKGAEQYLLICRSLHDAGYRKQVQP